MSKLKDLVSDVKIVRFGNIDIDLKPITAKTYIKLSGFIASTLAELVDIATKNKKFNDKNNIEQIMILISNLDEEKIYELIGIISGTPARLIRDNFKMAHALRIFRMLFEQEDVSELFFELSELMKIFKRPNQL